MKVKLLYFAALREQLGTGGEELELPQGVATVGALRAHLAARGGAWQAALAEGRLVRTALNQDMAKPGAPLRGGDEVAFFPPVTGG
ncbi:MAG: molybdopterin converting factor subunit 1 [Betaproteobacteria bacterium]|nr:molybdopterin converting factor subunit 1 [Betaproteobacteria bacterium]